MFNISIKFHTKRVVKEMEFPVLYNTCIFVAVFQAIIILSPEKLIVKVDLQYIL